MLWWLLSRESSLGCLCRSRSLPDSPAMRRAREHFARLTVGWFYFRNNPDTARHAGVLERDEARRMAVNFARLPELLRQGGSRLNDGQPGCCRSGDRRPALT